MNFEPYYIIDTIMTSTLWECSLDSRLVLIKFCVTSHLHDLLFRVKIFLEISSQILSRYFLFPCLEPTSCSHSGSWCVQWQEQPCGGDLQEAGAHPPGAQM